MGIFGLRSYILNVFGENNDVVKNVNFKMIKNYTIGFDIINLLHNMMKVYPSMYEGIDELLNILNEYDIKAYFIFDGIERNELKLPKTIQRRKENRLKDYRFEMIKIVDKYRSRIKEDGIFDIFKKEFKEYIDENQEIENIKYNYDGCIIISTLKYNKKYIDIFDSIHYDNTSFANLYMYLEKETKFANKEDIQIARNRIVDFIEEQQSDFTVITAPGEADFYLAKLYKDRIINICVSNDTDMLALGINNCILFDDINYSNMFLINRINLIDAIQKRHDINPSIRNMKDLFLNMCILSGTDYSVNIFIKNSKFQWNQDSLIDLLKYKRIDQIKTTKDIEYKFKNINHILPFFDKIKSIYISP